MDKNKIDRINELARLAKERVLTEEETAERETLRKEYISEWRKSTIDLLENTYIVDENGNKRKLEKKNGSISN